MRSATWRVRRIDQATWGPAEELTGVESFSVTRSVNDGNAPLLESGSMEVTGEVAEGYYRCEMLDSTGALVNVATLLFVSEGAGRSHGSWHGEVDGKSVLAPAASRICKPGDYAPMGVEGAAYVARRLRETIHAPVVTKGTFTLADHVIFDPGESVLDAIWKVLDAAGWCMQVSGDGTVTVAELPEEPALVVNSRNMELMMPEFETSVPVADVPNALMVAGLDGFEENVDPESPTSIPARGRRIEAYEASPTRKGGETLAQYRRRRLLELSDVYETIDVTREHVDGILPYSVIRANLPDSGVTGDFRVRSQKVACELGISVGETWGRRAQPWKG